MDTIKANDRHYLNMAKDWYRPRNGGHGLKFANLERRGFVESRRVQINPYYVAIEYHTLEKAP